MHPNPRRFAPVVLVVVLLSVAAYWFFVIRPTQPVPGALDASGTIEVTQVQIAAELGGRVSEVTVEEGARVQAGDVLLRLDDSLLQAQRAQLQAQAEAAEANAEAAGYNLEAAQATEAGAKAALDLLKAGSSAEQLAAANAQFSQAAAARLAAEASMAALTAGARPEQVAAARLRLDQARAAYAALSGSLDADTLESVRTARQTAAAGLKSARERLAGLQAGSDIPPAALETAAAALADMEAAEQAAALAEQSLLTSPQPFHLSLQAARSSLETARLAAGRARARESYLQALNDIPQIALDAARNTVEDADALSADTRAAVDALDSSPLGKRLRAAWDEVQAAQRDLNALARGGSPLEVQLYQADAANAARDLAAANLDAAQEGARSQQIDSAQAQLDAAAARTRAARSQLAAAQAQAQAAQAALAALDVQAGKMTLSAPLDGVVLTQLAQPGEFAAPGAVLLVLGRTAEKTITVYVPEELYGRLSVGQAAQVSVDSFPGEKFSAAILRIADQAEFTPRNVQTTQGRKNTVFAVKLRVDDPQDRLKPGMPADVVFGER